MKKRFIIAEIGINHNGDLNTAKKLIDLASLSGCDAVKFQKRTIEDVYSPEELDVPRESPFGTTNREQKMGLEFEKEEYDEIDRYCKELKIDWFFSAWDKDSLKFSDIYNFNYHKIASAMIVDISFLEEVAKRKKHTFISTGMSSLKNIQEAVDIFKKEDCSFELMHCVSTYPMKTEDANLLTIPALKKTFDCDVGYSGHENGVTVSLAALMFNISSLERHITLDRTMWGTDQLCSVEPQGLIKMVKGVRELESALGDGVKVLTESEKVIRKKLRG